ncbi:MAG: SPOR domain-containing protein [bacterium]|nr:SPOR domain-containing protein [bacterium]
MKKRVFYVINLDRGRIWVLATLLVSTLLFAFATGFRVGTSRSGDADLLSNSNRSGVDMELASLGATTGSPDIGGEYDERGDTTQNANADLSKPLELERSEQGASPFEKSFEKQNASGDRNEFRDANDSVRDGSRDRVMDSSSSLAAPAAVDRRTEQQRASEKARASEQERLAKARAAAQKKRAEAARRVAEKKKRDAAKRKRELARRAEAAQKNSRSPSATKTKSAKEIAAAQRGAKSASEKKQSAAKQSAQKSTTIATDNPRSALLESDSGSLRMANVSKETPRSQTESQDKAAKARETTQSNSRKTYSLQLGAFSSRAASDRMAATLKKQGFHPYIVQSRGKFLVRVGKSDTAKDLWKLETGLRKNKYAPMRVSSKSR